MPVYPGAPSTISSAALWGALDPLTDILYLYSEHSQGQAQPAVHAQGILSRGRWIPGVIDLVGTGRSESDRWRLLRIYREVGLDLGVAENSEQSGIYEVLQRMSSGRLKVFRTLANFFQEYRLYRRDAQGQAVKQNDLLMNCLRCLCVSGRDRLCTEPDPEEEQYRSFIPPGTLGGWMR